jgi:hypothetical protein
MKVIPTWILLATDQWTMTGHWSDSDDFPSTACRYGGRCFNGLVPPRVPWVPANTIFRKKMDTMIEMRYYRIRPGAS